MIRRMQRADIDRVADIWLDTNIRAHNFISKQYWQNNFSIVKEMLSQSEIYVYEEKGYAVIKDWKSQDVIALDMDMPVEIVAADPHVKENFGKRAIQRGPLVYCMEERRREKILQSCLPVPNSR